MTELFIAAAILCLWAIGYFIWHQYLKSKKFKWPNLGTREHPIRVRIEKKVQYASNVWKFHIFDVEIFYVEEDQEPMLNDLQLKKVYARLLGEFNSPIRTFIIGEVFIEDCASKGMLWETKIAHNLIYSCLEEAGLEINRVGMGNDLLKFDL